MNKFLPAFIFAVLFFVFCLAVDSIFFAPSKNVPHSPVIPLAKASNTHNALPAQAITYYAPKLLSIPKINLTASIVAVGLDSQKRMGVPNNFVDVGWYDLGYKPGEHGSAVLDGHSDDFHGNPAVFYNLDQLQKGDQIYVTDQKGKTYTYIVTDSIVYPQNDLPLQQIFASNDKTRLNLITCHGIWDNSIQTYNERTVIYAVLQS